jgi:hypothetical protein
LFLLGFVGVVSGCFGPSAKELHEAARSLLPPGSEVVAEEEGDCVELARSPSCVQIYFIPSDAARGAPASAVLDVARDTGWKRVGAETFAGGSSLRFQRRRLKAYVSVGRSHDVVRCRQAPKECADFISVERS